MFLFFEVWLGDGKSTGMKSSRKEGKVRRWGENQARLLLRSMTEEGAVGKRFRTSS